MASSSKKRVSAIARAVVTIEFSGLGSWGEDCSVSQVHRQGGQAALGQVRDLITKAGMRNARVLDCKVTMVSVEEK